MVCQPTSNPGPIQFLRGDGRFEIQVAVFKPIADRNPKTLFRTIDDSIGDQTPDRFLKNIFRDPAPELVARRNPPSEIDDVYVEKRTAGLKPMHHAGAIGFD